MYMVLSMIHNFDYLYLGPSNQAIVFFSTGKK